MADIINNRDFYIPEAIRIKAQRELKDYRTSVINEALRIKIIRAKENSMLSLPKVSNYDDSPASNGWTSSTCGSAADRHAMVAIDSRELAMFRTVVQNAEVSVQRVNEKLIALEAKFDKAIEILTSRGINITELI